MTDLPPEPFFSGPGLDRADALRANPAAIAALAAAPGALQLQWKDCLSELTEDGRLMWSVPTNPELFLGLDGDSARFSAIEPVTADARLVLPLRLASGAGIAAIASAPIAVI